MMVPIQERSEAPAWRTILDVLSMIDDLGGGATGQVVFGDVAPVRGHICIEDGRICWATARALAKRLTGALREHSDLGDVEFEWLYERCRAERKPIGQTLVEQGRLAPETFSGLLLQHSAESIVELCRDGSAMSMIPTSSRRHDPEFTFSAAEMLFEIGSTVWGDHHAAASAELAVYSGEGRSGFAFLVETEQSLAVPLLALDLDECHVRDMMRLARWSTAVLAGGLELGVEPRYSVGMIGGDAGEVPFHALATWRRGELLYTVACRDREALAAMASVALR